MNCSKINKGGFILLFSNKYRVNEVYKSEDVRIILTEIASDRHKLISEHLFFKIFLYSISLKFMAILWSLALESTLRSYP